MTYTNEHVHKACCKRCPSMQGLRNNDIDPETAEMRTYSTEAKKECVFVCAWRPEKYCKGVLLALELSDADVQDLPIPKPVVKPDLSVFRQ